MSIFIICDLERDPNADVEKLIDEFMPNYYGKAAPFTRKIYNRISEITENKPHYVRCESYAPGMLTKREYREFYALFKSAEEAVADKPSQLKRVKREKFPYLFCDLTENNPANGREALNGEFAGKLQEWVYIYLEIKDKEFIEDVGKVIGAYNKLLLIDKDFNWSIINESSGVWKEGCWLSNSYSTESSRNYYDCYSYGNYYNNSSKYNYHKDYKYYDNYGKSYNDWDDDDDYWDNYYNSKYNHEENKKKFNEVFGGDEKTELQKKLEADPFGSYDAETGEVFVD